MEKNMKKYSEVLKKCPLFFDIEDDKLIKLIDSLGARTGKFDKNSTIFAEGSEAKYMGVVLSGSVQITQVDYYGNRNILSILNEGELFAEAFACMQMKAIPVSVVANEQSEIMFIDCSHILSSWKDESDYHKQLIYNLMKSLATKTVMFQQKIEVTSKRTTREKLMTYLSLMAKKTGKNSFVIPFDRQELADYLEVDRTGLSAEISKLRKEGIIENKRSKFKLL